MAQEQKSFDDRQMTGDILASQQAMAAAYNAAAAAAHEGVKTRLMTLLGEEQQLAGDLLAEMEKRGWRVQTQAWEEELRRVREQHRGKE